MLQNVVWLIACLESCWLKSASNQSCRLVFLTSNETFFLSGRRTRCKYIDQDYFFFSFCVLILIYRKLAPLSESQTELITKNTVSSNVMRKQRHSFISTLYFKTHIESPVFVSISTHHAVNLHSTSSSPCPHFSSKSQTVCIGMWQTWTQPEWHDVCSTIPPLSPTIDGMLLIGATSHARSSMWNG